MLLELLNLLRFFHSFDCLIDNGAGIGGGLYHGRSIIAAFLPNPNLNVLRRDSLLLPLDLDLNVLWPDLWLFLLPHCYFNVFGFDGCGRLYWFQSVLFSSLFGRKIPTIRLVCLFLLVL